MKNRTQLNRSRLLAIASFALSASLPAYSNEVVEGVQLPPIPTRSSQAAQEPTSNPSLASKYRFTRSTPGGDVRKPLELQVRPGFNEIITIAKGHVNRIVTPFENPIIRTSSNISVHQEGRDIYITTPDETTVAMFVLDASGGPAISLSLLPRSAPPREIRLTLKDEQGGSAQYIPTKAALATETQEPYVSAIVSILTEIAKGKVPSGYQLADPIPDDHIIFYCPVAASKTELVQVIEGSKWRVGVTRVRNQSHYPIEVRESDCQADGRLAVSLFPSAVIPPATEVEMYIVVQRESRKGPDLRTRDYVFTR